MSAEAIATSLRAVQIELGEIREAPMQVRDALRRIADCIAWADALKPSEDPVDAAPSVPGDVPPLKEDLQGLDPLGQDRIFAYIAATGVVYTDRRTIVDGDYKRLGFLPFRTLEPDLEDDCPETLATTIRGRMARIQARRGETYQVSTAGQTVTLGA
jgi:hypothetical protein